MVRKIPAWGCAWSLGWGIFWLVFVVALTIFGFATGVDYDPSDTVTSIVGVSLGASLGGFIGGLVAGLVSMLTLRRYAPSIAWKHMAPAVRIWVTSGVLGILLSGLLTSIMLGMGMLAVEVNLPDCSGLSMEECMGASLGNAMGAAIGTVILILFVFIALLSAIWFLAGLFAGWLAVRHIRTLEPGITRGETRWVMFGWGLGAVTSAVTTLGMIGLVSTTTGW